MIRKRNNSIIWYFFYVLLIVDSINGFFMGTGKFIPLGIIYKLGLLLILLTYAIRTKVGALSFLFFLFYLVAFLYQGILCPTGYKLVDSLSLLSKFLLPFWGTFAMSQQMKLNTEIGFRHTVSIFRLNSVVLIINIILGLMGFGFSSYGNGDDYAIGTRGFFYAINELSGVFLVLFGFLLFCAKLSYSNKKYLFLFAFLMMCVVSFSTKTAMGGLLFIFVYLQFAYENKKNVFKMLLVILVLLPLIIYIGYRMALDSGLWDRWMYFYDKSDNWYSFLLSGRDSYWEENMSSKFYKANWFGKLFGLGAFLTVEMDPFDALLNFGIIGVLVVYSFWGYMIICAFKRRKTNILAKFVCFVDLLIVSFSLFAGHLMFSGLLGPFVPLLNALIYVPNDVFLKYFPIRNEKIRIY